MITSAGGLVGCGLVLGAGDYSRGDFPSGLWRCRSVGRTSPWDCRRSGAFSTRRTWFMRWPSVVVVVTETEADTAKEAETVEEADTVEDVADFSLAVLFAATVSSF